MIGVIGGIAGVFGMFELKKIGIIRRASALLLDAILLAVLSTGFIWIISLICNFSTHQSTLSDYWAQMDGYRDEYFNDIANEYGFIYTVKEGSKEYTITKETEEGVVASNEDELIEALDKAENRSERMQQALDAYKALPSSAKIYAQERLVLSMLFMMVSIGILLAYMILEFVLPIILKNGQTVGKKVFSVCLVKPNCVKMPTLALFARTLLGKFAIETMFPILLIFLLLFGGLGWLAIVLLAAITLLNVVLFFATKNRTLIHDLLASTVAVDMKLQMIYASEEELAAKKAQHKDFFSSSNN